MKILCSLCFLLGFVLFGFEAFGNTEDNFSPSGRTWFYEGSGLPAVKMLFKNDGSVKFETTDSKPAYSWLGPVGWKYSIERRELILSMPKAKLKDLEDLMNKEGKIEKSYRNPKHVDLDSKQVLYDFPDRINFKGLIFEEQKP